MDIGKSLDNLIAIFSPSTAVRRKNWRAIYGGAGGYDAANMTRKTAAVPMANGNAETDNAAARRQILAVARSLEKNSDMVNSMIENIVDNVIGVELNMQAQSPDSEFNKKIEAMFVDWSHKENCDVAGTQTLSEMARMALRRYIIDGGILAINSIHTNTKYPLQIQLKEIDDLWDFSLITLDNGNQIIAGVEVNEYGRPMAYHLKKRKAGMMDTFDIQRIPAERVSFLFRKDRVTQYREISRLTPSCERISDLDDYLKAIAFQQKAAACTSAFVECDNNTAMPGRPTTTQGGKRIKNLEAGTVLYLQPGEHIKSFIPQGQASEVESYAVTQMRMIAATQGLSLESATRNVERVNYSSARQNLLADQRTYKILHNFIVEHLLRPIYIEFINSCYLKGMLKNTKFEMDNPEYYKARWLTAGIPWIDPKKEAEADAIRLANGGISFQNYCAENGSDWKERIDDMAAVQEYAEEKGVKLNYIISTESLESNEENQNSEESEVKKPNGNKKPGSSGGGKRNK